VTPTIQAAIERVRALGAAMPRAVESGGIATGVGALSGTRVVTFAVSRRIFARMFLLDTPRGGEQLILWIRADPNEREALIRTGHPYFPAGPREVGMVLDEATDSAEVAELVTESYVLMAPKKLAAEVAAQLPSRDTEDDDEEARW
jgi:hypothetical protein